MAKNLPGQKQTEEVNIAENSGKEKDLTWYDKIKRDLLNNSVAAIIYLITGIIIGASQIPEAINKILITTGIKPDALTLATNDAKSVLTRNLIELGYKRIFWIQNYAARYNRLMLVVDSLGRHDEKSTEIINRMVDESDIDLAWNEYIMAVEGWSINLVINEQLLGKYYSDEKRKTFEEIHSDFLQIHKEIVDVRYKSLDKANAAIAIAGILEKTESLNSVLLFFVTGLEEDKKSETLISNNLPRN